MTKFFINNRKKLINYLLILIIFLILFYTAAFRKIGLDRDSYAYLEYIKNYRSGDSSFGLSNIEPTFIIILTFADYISDNPLRVIFIIYAALSLSIKFYAFKKLSLNFYLSILIYICLYFILHEMTQIRVGASAAFFLLALDDIYNKNKIAYFSKALTAVFFHYSALLMIPFYLINPRKSYKKFYFFLPLTGFALAYFSEYMLIFLSKISAVLPSFLSTKIKYYIFLADSGINTEINLFNIYMLSLIVIYYLTLFCSQNFKSRYDIIFLKILAWAIFFFYSLSFLPVLSFRISEFLAVILIVFIADLSFMFKQRTFLNFLIIIYSLGMLFNYIFIQSLIRF